MKVRIVEPALKNYTGMLYQVQFTGGVSDRELTKQEISIIGAAMRVESLEGKQQVGAGREHLASRSIKLDEATEQNAATEADINKAAAAESTVSKVEKAKISYTREQLEGIADKEGIAGLRAVAEPLGIKGRSINELITELLEYQGA